MRFVTFGEKVTPANREITKQAVSKGPVGMEHTSRSLTGLGDIEPFLKEVGNQSKQCYEASQYRAYDIEVCDSQDRHLVE